MITQMGFLSRAELHDVRDTLESWSQFCLNHLDDMARRAASEAALRPLHRLRGE